jgi:hypothetical protein
MYPQIWASACHGLLLSFALVFVCSGSGVRRLFIGRDAPVQEFTETATFLEPLSF